MTKNINELIINLHKELEEEYGKDFKNFYLVNNRENIWEGVIKTKYCGKNNVEYYTIEDKKIVGEEKSIY